MRRQRVLLLRDGRRDIDEGVPIYLECKPSKSLMKNLVNAPKDITELVRRQNTLRICTESKACWLLGQFTANPLRVEKKKRDHSKIAYRSLRSFSPSTSQSFRILSSPVVIKYFDFSSTAAHLTGPDFSTALLASSVKSVVE